MTGLREALDEIVADVPVYGDLDRAFEQADRARRRRIGVVAGIAAAAAVLVVAVGILVASRGTDAAPPISPTPTPSPPTPTPERTQAPGTWVDSTVSPRAGYGWEVPNPVTAAQQAWSAIVVDHLDPTSSRLVSFESYPGGLSFQRPADGSSYDTDVPEDSAHATYGRVGLSVERGAGSLFADGCRYLHPDHAGSGTESCTTERFTGPRGEAARISSYERRCDSWEGGGPAPATCGDYVVAVAVARRDGRVGFVILDGRGTAEFNPFTPAAMAATAADPRLTLPEPAFAVPSDQTVSSVVQHHFPHLRGDGVGLYVGDHVGAAGTSGRLGRLQLNVTVWPAGGTPVCGRAWLVECVERRVYGASDPTTVFVGAWDEEHWADRPRNSRAASRVFVYVGPRHTVVVREGRIVLEGQPTISPDLDQRLIDLALDPRLQ